jgi:hypothetical protein
VVRMKKSAEKNVSKAVAEVLKHLYIKPAN